MPYGTSTLVLTLGRFCEILHVLNQGHSLKIYSAMIIMPKLHRTLLNAQVSVSSPAKIRGFNFAST